MKKIVRVLYLLFFINLIVNSTIAQEAKVSMRKVAEGITYIKDVPNNKKYNFVQIGDNDWTTTSLWNQRYSDGKSIKRIYGSNDWVNTIEGAYGIGERSKYNTYGYVYNGYAIETRKLCPNNWRVAERIDYLKLQEFLARNENLFNLYSYLVDTTSYEIVTPRVVRCIRKANQNE